MAPTCLTGPHVNSDLDTVLAAPYFFLYNIPMIEKDELREQAILHRDRIRPESEDVEAIAGLFRDHIKPQAGQVVAAYWPMDNEIDVRYIIDDLIRQGIDVALPVTGKSSREMAFSRWDGKGNLVKGAYGVFVPPQESLVEPDIVLVPMLAFDRKGNRLGRGGGHYDATITALRNKKNVLVVGIAYASQAVLFNLPAEEHDQKMDMIITPQGVHDYRH